MSTLKSALKTATRASRGKKHIKFDAPSRYQTNDRFVCLDSTIKRGRVISECAFVPHEGRQYTVLFDGATSIECLREDYMCPENTRITKHKASSMVKYFRKRGWHIPDSLYSFLSAQKPQRPISVEKETKPDEAPAPKKRATRKQNSLTIVKVVTVLEKVITTTLSVESPTKQCSRAKCTRKPCKRGLCKTHAAAYRKKHAFA